MSHPERLISGHDVEVMSQEWMARVGQHLAMTYTHGVVRIKPHDFLYSGTVATFLNKIQSFQFRPDDVVVMTCLKAGTTWMQEILWTMLHNPDLNHPQADDLVWNRSPDISFDMNFDNEKFKEMNMDALRGAFQALCPGRREEDGMLLQILDTLPGPRVIKCHFPLDLMPKDLLQKAKVVYVARNPKDVMVSNYHFMKNIKAFDFKGPIDTFARMYMDNEIIYGPYWPHVLQAWEQRSHPNLHFVFYEDLKQDINTQLHKLNDFMGTKLTDQQLKNVVTQTSFSKMKSGGEPVWDKAVYIDDSLSFFRKGKSGDWRNHLSPEMSQKIDQWTKDNIGDSGIDFKWG